MIPQTVKTFDSVLGSTNRPFAAPGEPIEVTVRPCDTASVGLQPTVAANVVTIIFTPVGGGTKNAVVLTGAATCSAINPQLSACQTALGGGGSTATCVSGVSAGLAESLDGTHLTFRFPDTDGLLLTPGRCSNGAACSSDLDCGVGTCGAQDGRTFSGPATIVVSKASDPLPCGVAATGCSGQSGLIACVDDYFVNDGTCRTAVPQGTFNHFTALPPPNNFQMDCFSGSPPCTGTAPEFRVTTDTDGNVLMPVNWSGVLVRQNDVPVRRTVRAMFKPLVALTLPGKSFSASFTPEGGPLQPIIEPQFKGPAGTLTLFGTADAPYTVLRMAPRSAAFNQCTGGVNNNLPCNVVDDCPGACTVGGARCESDADCTSGTCGAPGTCGPASCVGGANAGHVCNSDANCPGGQCGASLFDVGAFSVAGVGPIVLPRTPGPGVCQVADTLTTCSTNAQCNSVCSMDPDCSTPLCVEFALEAQNPVPEEGVVQSPDLFAFVSSEGIDLIDRDGDTDTLDSVVTMRDRQSGQGQKLGAPTQCPGLAATAEGRAVERTHQPPFSFPATAVEGDLLAFLEAEWAENFCDENSTNDKYDSILRVFQLGVSTPVEKTAGLSPLRAVDAGPKVNGKSLAISNGKVFYRAAEGAMARRLTNRASLPDPTTGNTQTDNDTRSGQIVGAGRYVLLVSDATNLVNGDGNGASDVFIRDRVLSKTERVSVPDSSTGFSEGDNNSGSLSFFGTATQAVSEDGRFVAFPSDASNLVLGDTNLNTDIFLRDRCMSNGVSVGGCSVHTTRVSAPIGGGQANGNSYSVAMSPDARFLALETEASNLVPQGGVNILVLDRLLNTFDIATVTTDGMPPSSISEEQAITPDGRYVAFSSLANNMVPGFVPASAEVIYLRDRALNRTEHISVTASGAAPDGDCFGASISADGRYVAFASQASNILAPGATGGIYVRDRQLQTTELVSMATDGTAVTNFPLYPAMSADGRYVVFTTDNALVPDDTNGQTDVYVRDRFLGTTQRLSVTTTGAQGTGGSFSSGGSISADGHWVAFHSDHTNFAGVSDTNGVPDIFVRGPDLADPFGVHTTVFPNTHLYDKVLEVLDGTSGGVTPLCPADDVSVTAGQAAFLRPESDVGSAACPIGSLNGDADSSDAVVQFWPGSGAVQNLGVAATAVSMSGLCAGGTTDGYACSADADCPGGTCTATYIAALVSEPGQNATDLNGDGDNTDDVVEVHKIGDPLTTWTDVKQAADVMQASGSLVVFITPEAEQNKVLNGDGDKTDRVLQTYDAGTHTLTNVGQAAEEFVVGTQKADCAQGPLVAFRTSEAAQGKDLTGDGDTNDFVLQIFAAGHGVINTHQTVIPCRLEACDPHFPYRVSGNHVKFLTFEGDQGADLNGDGDQTDIVIQDCDACTGTAGTCKAIGTLDTSAGNINDPIAGPPGPDATFITAGSRCLQTLTSPVSCTMDTDCPAGARCLSSVCKTPLLMPVTCTSNTDCPTNDCEADRVVVAAAAVTAHDSVILPLKPVTATIPVGQTTVIKKLKVKVRNADFRPAPEKPGHVIKLTVADGTCPAGTVVGLPDFNLKVAGDQDSVQVIGGKTKTAVVTLTISNTTAGFMSIQNKLAPRRCTLTLRADTPDLNNQDPNSSNNVLTVDLNVLDANQNQTTTDESVIKSINPAKLTIRKTAPTMSATKTVGAKIINADVGEIPGDTITLSALDGDCAPGTVTVLAQPTQPIAGGKAAGGKIQISATNAAFTAKNAKSPGRCTAILTATGPLHPDADPSNNTTNLVVDVNDKEDY